MAPSVVIAAGGTGGHIYPGLAVAAALRRLEPDVRVVFVGTARGLEGQVIPAAGYDLRLIEVIPLSRRPGVAQLQAGWRLLKATSQARAILRSEAADVVVGMGGYTSLPVVAAARLSGFPSVLHESGAIPGLANRVAARLTRNVALAFPGAASHFPRQLRPRVVGMPLQPEIADIDRIGLQQEARAAFDLPPDVPTLLVVGGSQGAQRLNAAAVALAARWRDRQDVRLILKTGRDRVEEIGRAIEDLGGSKVARCVGFIERMDLAYAAADLALCRAGAGTVAEMAAAGLPAILVPYPHATADHQTLNARALAESGAAVVVPDAEATADRLAPLVEGLLGDPDRLESMSKSARGLARPHAAEELAQWVLDLAAPDDR
jgi:UDP-N-acetylglucosamine--N-acetylmuramyl-(pentapeptide) pyrophosphoryl-undecaprenol N-acetylglucosamine transferase